MSSVVQSSSSIYSTYISTIDHLPCDIVRSLWLVQSCNISAEKCKEKTQQILSQLPAEGFTSLTEEEYSRLSSDYVKQKEETIKYNEEALEELEGLFSGLVDHAEELESIVLTLEGSESQQPLNTKQSQDKLREQLRKHYTGNPLKSQVEALQEKRLSLNIIVREVSGQEGTIKIIFKIPKGKIETSQISGRARFNSNGSTRTDDEFKPNGRHLRNSKYRLRSQSISWDSDFTETPPNKMLKSKSQKKVATKKKQTGPGAMNTYILETDEESYASETEKYCFCGQPSFGDMIACDNENCANGEWFHYKCVGLLSKVEALKYAKKKWFCSDECKSEVEEIGRRNEANTRRKRRSR